MGKERWNYITQIYVYLKCLALHLRFKSTEGSLQAFVENLCIDLGYGIVYVSL